MFLLLCIVLFMSSHFQTVMSKNPSVIIIGAGPSGIAAATKLLENSITNITILEAENRIGGRINTVEFGNGVVEMGAEYCHGEEGNLVYELAKDFDLLEHSDPLIVEHIKVYNSNGKKISTDLSRSLIDFTINFENDKKINGSLRDAVLKRYNSTILKKYQDGENFKFATDGIRMVANALMTREGAFSWEEVSAGQHFENCDGDDAMTWKARGYRVILDILTKSYPNVSQKLPVDDKIFLNKKVTKIIWKDNQPRVLCEDKSSFSADHVIFTPSIGVLKKFEEKLFEPRLPSSKLNSIEAIGFDGVMKIMLHFPKQWWFSEEIFFLLWNKEDLLNSKTEFPEGPSKNGLSWITSISVLLSKRGNPNVVVIWVVGDIIPEIEKAPEDVVLRGCNYVIQKFLGKDFNITDADKLTRSQWVTNPNFLGTYSFEKVDYFEEDVSYQQILAEPLVNDNAKLTLLFAGEATHPTRYSTVDGAIGTGRREAERIINLYK